MAYARAVLGLVLSAIVLSLVGALAQRGAAAVLGVKARLVLGTGPRIGPRDREPGAIEIRPLPVWVSARIVEVRGGLGRAIAALAAGPIAMLLLPAAILVIAVVARGAEEVDPGPPLVVGFVEEGSPAHAAGIAPGDVIESVDGRAIDNLASLIDAVRTRGGIETPIVVTRGGSPHELSLVPLSIGDRAVIGVRARSERRAVGVGEAIAVSARAVIGLWRNLISSVAPDDHDGTEPIVGPVGLRGARDGGLDGATRVALIALAWTAVAPLWAIVASIGSTIAFVGARRR
ncbi:M50 family metallopeptidase [Sandaracinus amylolyticus]|uniref:M50 family metallopeptidase n=1 Tax=Sandaracinus amylolyticus TaxID=927083 RepID=UPI001F47B8BD|nr:M50 family metallopeptidase [Sandaracinus amylolyticus]UJR84753.1 Hypothetical protein I5071_68320 [Sandaracinus amylolyticus]